jgi:hypothetical protein
MTSTLEMVNKKDGTLPPNEVVESELTKALSSLYILKQMLPEDQKNVKGVVEDIRIGLVELRGYLGKHFTFTPAE